MSDDFINSFRRLAGPMARQIRMMISRAIINLVNDDGGLQEVQVGLLAMPQPGGTVGRELSDNVEVVRQYGFTAHPHPGAEAVFVSVAGIRSHGLVIAIEDRRYRLTGLAAGEVALYDDLGQTVHLTRTGIVIKGAGLPLTITDAPKVRIETPILQVTGDIVDQCDGQGRSMASMRQIYNQHTHPVPNVQTGTGLATTTTPTQQE